MAVVQQPNRRWRMRRGDQGDMIDPMSDRRRPRYDRRGQDPVQILRAATRPGANEAAPRTERRRVPGATE